MLAQIVRAIERRAGWVLAAAFGASLAVVGWYTIRQNQLLLEASAVDAAKLYTEALAEFRSLYTSEVVDRLGEAGVEVVHDYDVRSGSVPLPATMTILLGERIGDEYEQASVQLYSPYPFPWRESTGGLRDDFAREAWDWLNVGDGLAFYRFDEIGARTYLRYATADRMQPACVTCHNSHESTPRTGWQVGDVRGVLEIRYPLDQVMTLQGTGRRNSLILLAAVFGFGVIGLGTVVHTFGRRQKLMDLLVSRRTEELRDKESQIRSVVASIVEAVILIDEGGKIQSANAAAEQMFGYAEAEVLGKNVSMLMPSPYQEEHDGYLKHYLETGERKIIGVGGRRLKGLRRDGEVFDMELAVSESGDGADLVFTGIVRDISVQLEYERELEELSSRDGLTGLPNRRSLDRALEEEWRRCLRGNAPMAVALFDIDHFKQYNDHYGHLSGDECLKRVAQAMAQQVHRAGDSVARFGGEEFALVLPEADITGAEAVAEQIRQAVSDLGIPHAQHSSADHVTVSAGVASRIPTADIATQDLIHAADMALYRAKEAGRNQVQVASPGQ